MMVSLVGMSAVASAAATTVYSNEPAVLPGNVPSLAYESTSTSEFGAAISLAGTERKSVSLRFAVSSWGCENGTWNGNDCQTTAGAKFPVDFSAKIYAIGPGNSPGALLAQSTSTRQVPYRPSANIKKCTGANAGKWYRASEDKCFNGRLSRVRIPITAVLPDDVIVSVAYNTTHYGYNPIGESALCYTTSGGCGYDSLNVAVSNDVPTIGTQPNPDDGWLNSTWAGAYCDGGTGGTGSFRFDAGCWTGYQPQLKLIAK